MSTALLDAPLTTDSLLAMNGEAPSTIRAARKARGLTQVAFAAKAGINPAYFNRIERGRVPLTTGVARSVVLALHASEVTHAPRAEVRAQSDTRSMWQQVRDVEQEAARLREENATLRQRLSAITSAIRGVD